MEEIKYTKKQIEDIVECINMLEIKGITNIGLISKILNILNSPLNLDKKSDKS